MKTKRKLYIIRLIFHGNTIVGFGRTPTLAIKNLRKKIKLYLKNMSSIVDIFYEELINNEWKYTSKRRVNLTKI